MTLSAAHYREIVEESAVSPEIARGRGYFTARRGKDVPEEFADYQRRPGLVVPMRSPDGITHSYQLKPGRKGARARGPKYVNPAGRPTVVDCHPTMLEEMRHGDGPLLITEGAKTGDAATSHGIPTLVLPGVDMAHVKGTDQLRPDFDHVRLEGRPVYICFDSDCMTKVEVQRALTKLAGSLRSRGADVKVVYLPDAANGSKQGVDDYLAAGGTIREMFMLAREFEPADIGKVRMSRDDKLRAAVGHLWRSWYAADWMHFTGGAQKGHWARGHTARDVMEALIELAARSGKLDGEAVEVEAGLRKIAELSAKSTESSRKALSHLKAAGQIEIRPPEDKSKPRRYRLPVPDAATRARVDSMEATATGEGVRGGSSPRCQPLRAPQPPAAPRLRWSSPARPARREFEAVPGTPHTGRVRHTGAPTDDHKRRKKPAVKRLGPHRGAVVDTLEAYGDMHLEDLCEALHRKRPRDVRRRILAPLEEAGIVRVEGDMVSLTSDWREKLEEERERAEEIAQAEDQRKKHREQSKRYREHLERVKQGTPAASLRAVEDQRELRERKLREKREEEEKDRARTPPEVESFIRRILAQHDRLRMGLLCNVAREEGLRERDIPPAVERMGYQVERLIEYDNQQFIFTESERRKAAS